MKIKVKTDVAFLKFINELNQTGRIIQNKNQRIETGIC